MRNEKLQMRRAQAAARRSFNGSVEYVKVTMTKITQVAYPALSLILVTIRKIMSSSASQNDKIKLSDIRVECCIRKISRPFVHLILS